jgi:Fe2+ transport system protein B
MYKIYMGVMARFTGKEKDWDIMSYLYSLLIIYCSVINILYLIVYFLCRLKINHDSHEFILELAPSRTHIMQAVDQKSYQQFYNYQ